MQYKILHAASAIYSGELMGISLPPRTKGSLEFPRRACQQKTVPGGTCLYMHPAGLHAWAQMVSEVMSQHGSFAKGPAVAHFTSCNSAGLAKTGIQRGLARLFWVEPTRFGANGHSRLAFWQCLLMGTVSAVLHNDSTGMVNPGTAMLHAGDKQLAMCYMHHLLSSKKRRDIRHWAEELSMRGFVKCGYPGILVVEGLAPDLHEYLSRLKALPWAAFQVSITLSHHLLIDTRSFGVDFRLCAPAGDIAGCLVVQPCWQLPDQAASQALGFAGRLRQCTVLQGCTSARLCLKVAAMHKSPRLH